jgi:hypothetical protein
MQVFEFTKPVVFHRILNPKLWADDQRLHKDVQVKLLQIAREFISGLELDSIPLRDIVITGSNCNLTYTRHSDLDLHIRMDLSSIGPTELVQDMMQSKKALWNEQHDIRLHRIPVELYVEDLDQTVRGSVYSILTDQWLQQVPLKRTQYDDVSVRAKFRDWSQRIEQALADSSRPEQLAQVRERLRTYRRSGLDSRGEFSTENLTFKALRNAGYLDRLEQQRLDLESDVLSLPEQQ